jgi:hypothetical protein
MLKCNKRYKVSLELRAERASMSSLQASILPGILLWYIDGWVLSKLESERLCKDGFLCAVLGGVL